MTVKSISSLENVSFKAKQTESKEKTAIKAENSISDGTKKLLLALGVLGTVAAAGIAIYKGRSGIGKLRKAIKSGETGVFDIVTKNGDKFSIELDSGKIMSSTKKGFDGFEKSYEYFQDGKIREVVTITSQGGGRITLKEVWE